VVSSWVSPLPGRIASEALAFVFSRAGDLISTLAITPGSLRGRPDPQRLLVLVRDLIATR
jgi:hypothetical protein